MSNCPELSMRVVGTTTRRTIPVSTPNSSPLKSDGQSEMGGNIFKNIWNLDVANNVTNSHYSTILIILTLSGVKGYTHTENFTNLECFFRHSDFVEISLSFRLLCYV